MTIWHNLYKEFTQILTQLMAILNIILISLRKYITNFSIGMYE